MSEKPETGETSGDGRVVIKKYANRRLYNTASSSYVTLDHLSDMVKEGVDFVVFDAKSGDDITRSVLTQIIFEEENRGAGTNLLPIQFLRQLIRFYGDNMQAFLPSYLELSLEAFAKQQERMRGQIGAAASPGAAAYEETIRQNLVLFDQAAGLQDRLAVRGPAGALAHGGRLLCEVVGAAAGSGFKQAVGAAVEAGHQADVGRAGQGAALAFELKQELLAVFEAAGVDLGRQLEVADAVVGQIGPGVDGQRVVVAAQPAGELAAALLDEADQLAQESPHLRSTWNSQASQFRAAFALQRGDRAGLDRALDARAQSCHELQHAELIWHCDRMRVVDRMNRGLLHDAASRLRELRELAKSKQLFAHEMVCGNDFFVLIRQTKGLDPSSRGTAKLARPGSQDSPGILAIKLRAAVEVQSMEVARSTFAELAKLGFERLPCDRDYLGVLCHLAFAAIMLQEREHARALSALLAPHAALYSCDISFHSDGCIAHVLGLLARFLGQHDQAVARFKAAIAGNDRMELRARAAESRFELADTLMTGGADERCTARELLLSVQSAASKLGLEPLLARTNRLLKS